MKRGPQIEDLRDPLDIDRRAALQLNGERRGVGRFASCGTVLPRREIVPYVNIPETADAPGICRCAFASTLAPCGLRPRRDRDFGRRPADQRSTAIPRHPASVGATRRVRRGGSPFSLRIQTRSKARKDGGTGVYSWDAFEAALRTQLGGGGARGATVSGLRILTNRITSPTLLAQIDTLVWKSFPQAKWYRYEPGRRRCRSRRRWARAFGRRRFSAIPRLGRWPASRVTLDADPIGPGGPKQIRFGHEFHQRAQVQVGIQVGHLEQAPGVSLRPSMPARVCPGLSDRRQTRIIVSHSPAARSQLAIALAERALAPTILDRRTPCRGGAVLHEQPPADLKSASGAGPCVLAGRRQPAEIHAPFVIGSTPNWKGARSTSSSRLIRSASVHG